MTTDFAATGLPWDEKVFKAFMAFDKGPGLGPEDAEHPVKMAQLFNNVAASNTQLQALAFLAYIPEAAYGAFEKRFGRATVDYAREISAHMRTSFAYIDEASDPVKAFAMADNMAWIDALDAKFYDIAGVVHEADEKGEKPKVQMPMLPSQRVLDTIAKFAITAGEKDLYGAFIDKIERYRESLPEKLEVLGLQMPAAPEFKPFNETGLLNTPSVRNAYEALLNNPRVSADDLAVATEAAQLLSSQPSTRNPTAIAEALLDIGLPRRSVDDLHFLQNRIDWDVLELFATYNVRTGEVPGGVANAPIEFRQTALSFATVAMNRSLKNVQAMFEFIDNNPERFEASTVPLIKSGKLSELGGFLRATSGFLKELGDSAEAPELKGLLETKIDAVAGFIAEKTPKPMLMLPAPKKKPGAGFDLSGGQSFDL